jgi:hypothetical protein
LLTGYAGFDFIQRWRADDFAFRVSLLKEFYFFFGFFASSPCEYLDFASSPWTGIE